MYLYENIFKKAIFWEDFGQIWVNFCFSVQKWKFKCRYEYIVRNSNNSITFYHFKARVKNRPFNLVRRLKKAFDTKNMKFFRQANKILVFSFYTLNALKMPCFTGKTLILPRAGRRAGPYADLWLGGGQDFEKLDQNLKFPQIVKKGGKRGNFT